MDYAKKEFAGVAREVMNYGSPLWVLTLQTVMVGVLAWLLGMVVPLVFQEFSLSAWEDLGLGWKEADGTRTPLQGALRLAGRPL
jgi:hypothetical protein